MLTGHEVCDASEIRIDDDGALELYLDGCLRKRREPGERQPRYVWTNVELEWEEHHYIEARYWASSGRLQVTINGELATHHIYSFKELEALQQGGCSASTPATSVPVNMICRCW